LAITVDHHFSPNLHSAWTPSNLGHGSPFPKLQPPLDLVVSSKINETKIDITPIDSVTSGLNGTRVNGFDHDLLSSDPIYFYEPATQQFHPEIQHHNQIPVNGTVFETPLSSLQFLF